MSEEINSLSLNELAAQVDKSSTTLAPLNLDLVGHMSVSVSVNIGTADISLNQLFSLKTGELLQLNEHLNSPVTLMVDGMAVARGNLIAVNDCFGVQITEMANT